MVSTASNDVFGNKLPLSYIRGMVTLITIPIVVVAIKRTEILQIFLISNIFATSSMPSILLGLSNYFYFLNGFDIICSGLGGVFSVFIFGAVYYDDARKGANLIIMTNGLYGNDWSAFGMHDPFYLLNKYSYPAIYIYIRTWINRLTKLA